MRRLAAVLLVVLIGITSACGNDTAEVDETGLLMFPRVVDVTVGAESAHVFTFAVTISSPYDSAERYADAWRIVGPDGTVYGTRELAHHHAGEQPFTRSLSGVEIPAEVITVEVEGRDQLHGWGGATVEVDVPHGTG